MENETPENETAPNIVRATTECLTCAEPVAPARWKIGYRVCLECGESRAALARKHWCIVPMHKSNYFLCTDTADLKGINNKGGIIR
jgi:Zn finger protein HypA/HybF involved in hydrogenase expression